MNLLCIDTSTKNLSMAVSCGEKVLKYRNVKLNRPLDRSIMPGIQKILKSAGMPAKKLDGFAVGLGPGSFTSLRVGLSAVKGLAFGLKKPVIGVPSLDILAMNVGGDTQVCTLCDARRNLVYACTYEKKGLTLKRTSDYSLSDIYDVLQHISGEVTFIGDGVELYKNEIASQKRIVSEFINGKHSFPQARRMARLVKKQVEKGKWDNIDKLIPLYLYSDQCQIKVRSKK